MATDTRLPSFWDTVSQDAAAVGFKVDPHASFISRVWQVRRAMRHKPGFACVFWLRVNQLFIRKKWRGQFRIRMWRQYRFANDISPYADIGPGLYLPHPVDVTIGASVKIGRNAIIYNGVTLIGIEGRGLPRLGDNVIVYTGAKVIKPVHIGDNSEIGALSLCNKDVPPQSVMYGIPPNVTIKPKEKNSLQ
ncbi:MAG: serine acetyltransferase [Minisyncoccia bacterium]|jgi:serine O-acetyltransferase